jgi:energy-coupling factor transporter ATP-binding protein EcfA2
MSDGSLETFYEQVGSESSADRDYGRNVASIAAYSGQSDAPPRPQPAGPVSAWAVSGDQYWGITHSIDRIGPGCYRAGVAQGIGVYLERQPIKTDALIELPDSKSELIIAEIEQFMTLRPAFVARGLLFKRGVLLWGPPGSGKTSTLHLLMRLIVDRLGGIALLVDEPNLAGEALKLIRKIEPQRQVIAILEDVDGLIGNHGPSGYLALLDGESQVDNIVFVATTNYPERLDKRFVDRPSRFDTVEYVGMPSAEARRAYLTHKEPALPVETIDEMVEATDGLSVAHLREMIILTQCFKRSIADAAARLTASRRRVPSSERAPDRPDSGFGQNRLKDAALRMRQGCGTAAGGSYSRG